tara:strand:- start:443 stop:1192 length:750 start_codon:yes stop_codon:yes gene_type:complete
MIISHKHKFIFIKTFKVSGTSMEIALSNYLGKQDIITPINLEEEILRYKKTGIFPRNYSSNQKEEKRYNRYIKLLAKKKLSKKVLNNLEKKKEKRFKKMIFFNHISGLKIKKLIDKKIWSSYFKFTIERNPYDKVISFMFFANRFKKVDNLEKETNKTIELKKYLNYPLYMDNNNKIIVDYIINYNSLKKDIKYVEKKINLNISKFYLKTKNYTRKDKRHFSKLLNLKQMKKINKDAKFEFNLMNYKKK